MFVIDAFIGNWDRHNGNWGFLYNQEKNEMRIVQIFDCCSSLFPQIDEKLIKKLCHPRPRWTLVFMICLHLRY